LACSSGTCLSCDALTTACGQQTPAGCVGGAKPGTACNHDRTCMGGMCQ
jgi:hypothetical protein